MTRRESPGRLTCRLALGAVGLAAAAVLLLGFAAPAAAAEITVNTTDPGWADGRCSLEEAIKAANTDAAADACPAGDGDDVVTFSAPGVIDAPEGGFRITSNMTVQGRAGGTAIRGDNGFDIVLTAAESSSAVTAVTLADLRLFSDPWWKGEATAGEYGVHVKDESGAGAETEYTVVMENLRVDGYDFGVRVDKVANSGRHGTIEVRSSEVVRHMGQGSNVYLDACDTVEPFHKVALTIMNSAIEILESPLFVPVADTVDSDDPEGGAGVHNDCGHLKVIGSTIVSNRVGISASGGKQGKGGDAGEVASTRTEIINSSINGNKDAGVSLWKDSSSLKPELLIVNSTITHNAGGGIRTKWEGAGQHDGEYFDVEIFNSVVGGNTGRQCELVDSLVGDAESGNASSDDSCGFGLVIGGFGLGGLWPGGGGVKIGPSGGELVWMRPVNRHSPLIDAVTGLHCPHEKAPTDARGVSRPQGFACDVGAYETEYGEHAGRMWGPDRYGTAAAISRETFAPGVRTVYVATGVDFPDALAGSAASGGAGPILLMKEDSIPSATLTELERLEPDHVVVLGGRTVVSAEVHEKLSKSARMGMSIRAGYDRYSTAAVVSAGHFDPEAAVAFVATGEDFPDALAGGPAAAKLGGPSLLTRKGTVPTATVWELKRLKPKRIVVLGGTSVVSEAVEKALAAYTSGEVSRLAGFDRYSTAAAVSAAHFDPGVPVAYVATGLNFPDALSGGAALGGVGPILLTMRDAIPKVTREELARLKPKQVVVLGSESVVSKAVENALAAYAR